MKAMEIRNPWLIVDQADSQSPIRTIIAGPRTATYEEFGLVICDVIRHVARAKHVSDAEVFEWVRKEFERPTTGIETLWQTPSGRA